jgi:hypothetical protein
VDSLSGVVPPPSLDPERFYRDVLHALGEHARRRGATAQGAAVVVKRVARAHGLQIAEALPLPRLTREELDDQGLSRSGYRRVISAWGAAGARPEAGAAAPPPADPEATENG